MTIHYNRASEKNLRRQLRNNMTAAEKIIWKHLRKKQLGVRFLRQYSVDQFVIDFYCPKLKLALEIDGKIHNLPENKNRDVERQIFLESFGINFLRIKNEELFEDENKILEKVEQRIIELTGNEIL